MQNLSMIMVSSISLWYIVDLYKNDVVINHYNIIDWYYAKHLMLISDLSNIVFMVWILWFNFEHDSSAHSCTRDHSNFTEVLCVKMI